MAAMEISSLSFSRAVRFMAPSLDMRYSLSTATRAAAAGRSAIRTSGAMSPCSVRPSRAIGAHDAAGRSRCWPRPRLPPPSSMRARRLEPGRRVGRRHRGAWPRRGRQRASAGRSRRVGDGAVDAEGVGEHQARRRGGCARRRGRRRGARPRPSPRGRRSGSRRRGSWRRRRARPRCADRAASRRTGWSAAAARRGGRRRPSASSTPIVGPRRRARDRSSRPRRW